MQDRYALMPGVKDATGQAANLLKGALKSAVLLKIDDGYQP